MRAKIASIHSFVRIKSASENLQIIGVIHGVKKYANVYN